MGQQLPNWFAKFHFGETSVENIPKPESSSEFDEGILKSVGKAIGSKEFGNY